MADVNERSCTETLDLALGEATKHLRKGETAVPAGVVATIRFFVTNGLWFLLSRNPTVMSCRDAAYRRNRLGHRGIPLADELRSYLAEGTDADGRTIYVLLHCRGDASIDFHLVSQVPALQTVQLERATIHEFGEERIGYGLVNPFTAPGVLAKRSTVVQVFDPSVFDGSGETKTMMTNAGDKTWAVEFNPRELMDKLGYGFAIVEQIVPVAYRRHIEDTLPIGILTGNAPESGSLLWRKINRQFRSRRGESFRGDVSYPRVLVHSLPAMGWSMELAERESQLFPQIRSEVASMTQSGAAILAFACNTTQFYELEIMNNLAPTGARYLGMSHLIRKWIEDNKNRSIFVAGIGYVTGDKQWSAFPFLRDFPNVRLPDEHQASLIQRLAYEVKQNGVNSGSYQKFRQLVRMSNSEKVLLLLTELSMILERFPRDIIGKTKIVDGLDLYADTILDAAMISNRS
jgi:aspartate/glutamate racemase